VGSADPAFGSAAFRLDKHRRLLVQCRHVRLRRLVLSDRFFFVTVKLLPKRRPLDGPQFAVQSRCLSAVRSQGFALTAWVFLRDHWHAILYPTQPLTVSAAMKSIKLSSTNGLGRCRREAAELWQGRFLIARLAP